MNGVVHKHLCNACIKDYQCTNPECQGLGLALDSTEPPTYFLVCHRCYLVTNKRFRAAASTKVTAVPTRRPSNDEEAPTKEA